MKKFFYAICGLLAAGKVNAMDFNQDLTGRTNLSARCRAAHRLLSIKMPAPKGIPLTMNIKSKVRLTANAAVLFPLLHKSEIL